MTAAFALPGAASAATTSAGQLAWPSTRRRTTADFSQDRRAASNVVMLQEWEQDALHALKAANPASRS